MSNLYIIIIILWYTSVKLTLTNEQNELVLKKVFDYIRKSERFLIV
jgi:hypothetical protein